MTDYRVQVIEQISRVNFAMNRVCDKLIFTSAPNLTMLKEDTADLARHAQTLADLAAYWADD